MALGSQMRQFFYTGAVNSFQHQKLSLRICLGFRLLWSRFTVGLGWLKFRVGLVLVKGGIKARKGFVEGLGYGWRYICWFWDCLVAKPKAKAKKSYVPLSRGGGCS